MATRKWTKEKRPSGREGDGPDYNVYVLYGKDSGQALAEVAQTGTTRDNYPWEWFLTDEGLAVRKRQGATHLAASRTHGTVDSMKSGKGAAEYALFGLEF